MPKKSTRVAKGTKGEEYLNIRQAAIELGVCRRTVYHWIARKRLKARFIKTSGGYQRTEVARSSFADAFNSKCIVCGTIFRAKHPEKAVFCTYEHQQKWFAEKRRKEAAAARKAAGRK